ITLTTDYLSFNDMPIGRLSLKTTPNNNGLTIQSLQASSPYMSLRSGGSITQTKSVYATQLQGSLQSNDFSGLLGSMGLGAHNFISKKGQINFNLNWRDDFIAPNLATMSG